MNNENKFILLHLASNNTPVIVNIEHIMAIYRKNYNDNDNIMKTCIVLDSSKNTDDYFYIYVNESVERVYNIIEANNKK